MAYKCIGAFVLFFVVCTQAVLVVPSPPVLAKQVEVREVDALPQYQYAYDIQDSLSGDNKGHVEERDGDVVRGEYSLIDPDGFRRTVTYTADPVNGFNAVVKREPIAVAAPLVKAAPLVAPLVKVRTPTTFTAPIVA